MNIYEIDNPCFLTDTFIFGEILFQRRSFHCFVKVNCYNKVEEIGTKMEERLFGNWTIDKIIEKSREATKLHKSIFKRFDTEYWYKLINSDLNKRKW